MEIITAQVTVCVTSSSFNNGQPIAGAEVQCWDDDTGGVDDKICHKGMTGHNGCYTTTYDPDSVGDYAPGDAAYPDVFCTVYYHGVLGNKSS